MKGVFLLHFPADRWPISNAITSAATTAPRSPWHRLHFSTWLVLLFGLVVAAVVNVPGNDVRELRLDKLDLYDPGSEPTLLLTHGWPMTYAVREVKRPPFPQTIEPSVVWNPTNEVQEFRFLQLALDAVLALAVVAALVALFERRRRRSRRLQFRLRTLMIAMTLAAVAFGWWRSQREEDIQLRSHLAAIDDVVVLTPQEEGPISRLPLWLRVAVGEERLAALGINEPPAMSVAWSPELHEHLKFLIERFPARIHLLLAHPTTEDDRRQLEELTDVEAISLELTYCVAPTDTGCRLDSFKRLRYLSAGSPTHILCPGSTRIEPVDLKKMTSVEHFCLSARGFNERGFKSFGSLPRVRMLSIEASIVDDSTIAILEHLTQLKCLEVWGLWPRNPENAALLQAKLQRSLPECEVSVQ